ncbi:MAG: DUF692 domain-containing protein [Polyangiaceae bacterium]
MALPAAMAKVVNGGVGVGLRWDFLDDLVLRIREGRAPEVPFFEVTPENHMRRGGALIDALDTVASRYPMVSHGLAMSVGSLDPLDSAFVGQIARFLDRYELPFHSDHLCFSGICGRKVPDLLPLPLSRAAARHAARRVREVRDRLGRPFAIENISYYLTPGAPEMPETEFLTRVLEESDAGLLLDVNNVFVNSQNFGFDPWAFIEALPLDRVIEIHIAGHEHVPERGILIDTHGAGVIDPVHHLLRKTIARTGPVPVVLERDNHVPPLDDLLREAAVVREHYELGLADREQASRGGAA